MHIEAAAFEAVQALAREPKLEPLHAASLELAHLIRAHGLAATMGYCLSSSSDSGVDRGRVATSFLGVLATAGHLGGADAKARAETLKTVPHADYLLHSRLALRLADAWEQAARVLLKPERAPERGEAHA